MKRGLTREAMDRNSALNDAVNIISKDKRFANKTVKKESGSKERGVTVGRGQVML